RSILCFIRPRCISSLNWPYLRSIEARFDFNVAQTRSQATVTKIVGNSQDVLRNLPLNTFDLAYIDGSHLAVDVLTDAVLTWGLVKVGGTIIFDDYDYNFAQTPEQNTGIAVDAFVNCFCHKVKLIHKANQVILEKIAA
ncbi:class I SAM-dependent methyltransferase, partial [Tumidithrix elongata RA019]|nr:class I SAM-dependent methyltransferase [Tumidithrix elongata RA019]